MEMNFDFMKDSKKADSLRSRPGSGLPNFSFRSAAFKLYSGVKFYDVKRTSSRPSSRTSIKSKSSYTSKRGINTIRLGSIASKLKQQKPVKVEPRFIDFRTEVNFLFTCDLCSEDDKNIPAHGFCSECKQYMCADCLTFHRKVNATKSHSVMIGEDLQKTTKDSGSKGKSYCSIHPAEILKYYCTEHSSSICEKCKFIEHAKCEKVVKVSDLAGGIHKSKETKRIIEDIDAILTEFQYLKQEREADLKEIQTKKEETINSIKTTRTQITELLDTIESETLQSFNDSIDPEISKIQKQTATFDSIIQLLHTFKEDIVSLKENERSDELFLAVKNASADIKQYSNILVQTHKDSYKFNIKFEPNETLKEFYQSLDSLGQVRIRKIKTGCVLPSLSFQPHSEREALFAGEVNIYFQTDTTIPSIYKIQELTDSWLLLSDTANEKLKLFDFAHKAICELTLPSAPKGMTFLPPSEIVVALTKERCIQRVFLDKESGLILGRKCITKLSCIDLVSYGKNMVGLAENKTRFFINLMNTQGHDLKCIRRESKSTGMFTNLMYINRNKEGATIYVSDSVSGCFAISIDGDILFHISDSAMDDYRGICVNSQEGLYIAGCQTNNIVLFSSTGEKVKEVVDKNLSSPSSVCYSTVRNQLVISYAHAHTLKVFTLL